MLKPSYVFRFVTDSGRCHQPDPVGLRFVSGDDDADRCVSGSGSPSCHHHHRMSRLGDEEVETLVTQPIEIAFLGANGVEAVRSQSTAGLNVIYIEFDWDTEIRAARQTVQERLSRCLELPEGINPQMTPPSSIMGQIVIAGMYRQKGPTGGTTCSDGQNRFDGRTDCQREWCSRFEGLATYCSTPA